MRFKNTHFNRYRGFTLIELLIGMIIVAILTTVGAGAYQSYINRTRIARAIADISAIAVEIAKFDGRNTRYPDSLAELGIDPQRYTDPWGNPYRYLNVAALGGVGGARKDHNNVQMNRDFDLYSVGPDGVTNQTFTATASQDDIVRALSGQWVGTTEEWAATY